MITQVTRHSFFLGLALMLALPSPALAADELSKGLQVTSLIKNFLEVIALMHEVQGDPEKAGIFQLQKIQELYTKQGKKKETTAVLEEVLESTKSRAIRNSAYMMLADIFKETGESDKAIDLLKKGLKENLESLN